MNSRFTRRRCALLLGGFSVSALAGGCSSMFARRSPSPTPGDVAAAVQTAPEPIHIVYRTRTDRLNLAGAKLPHCSIAELRIDFPHHEYEYKAEVCSAVVKTTPCSASATPFPERGASSAIASMFDGAASDGSVPASAGWSGDVALWEAQAIVASLEKLNFFRKHRTVLSAEVFLSVETGKYAVGKKYRPVAELDAMIQRIVQGEGQRPFMAAIDSRARGELTLLPALQ